jgi:hypothetical protein
VTDEKSQFMFFEKWKNMEMENRATQHLKAFRQSAGSLLAKPIEVTLFGMISKAGKSGEIAGLLRTAIMPNTQPRKSPSRNSMAHPPLSKWMQHFRQNKVRIMPRSCEGMRCE